MMKAVEKLWNGLRGTIRWKEKTYDSRIQTNQKHKYTYWVRRNGESQPHYESLLQVAV